MEKGRGFTVIEVILFLAVSATLLGIALTYTAQTLKNARYSDTTKSFEAFIEQQYSEVQAGTATRSNTSGPTPPGGCVTDSLGASDNCVVLGRLLTFYSVPGENKVVRQYTVVADASSQNSTGGDFQAFESAAVRAQESIDAPVSTYSLDWGAQFNFFRYNRGGSGVQGFNTIAILRSPVSESMYIFTFNRPDPTTLIGIEDRIVANNANRPAVACFTSQDFGTSPSSLVASITFNGSSTIDSIDSVIKRKTETRVGALACV